MERLKFTIFFSITAMILYWSGCSQLLAQNQIIKPAFGKNTHAPKPENEDIRIYFASPDGVHLTAEKRQFSHSADPAIIARHIIANLIAGPNSELLHTLPESTRLRSLFIMPNGIMVVDLDPSICNFYPQSTTMELMSIYSIVNSIILNIPDIKAVQFLMGGNERPTLCGHVDLRYPLKANLLMIR